MAWAKAQSATGTSTSPVTGTLTKAFTSNVVAGNRIFVLTASTAATGSQVNGTPTDSQGNTYTQLVQSSWNGTAGKTTLYSAVVGSSAACTVSVPAGTLTGTGSELGFSIMEYSGLDSSAGTGCRDASSTGSGTASPISAGTTAATTAAGQLALACVGDWGQSLTYTAPSGFVLDTTACVQANAITGIAVANKTSASGATETGTFAYTPTGAASAGALIAVIKLAGAATAVRPGLPNRRFWRAAHRSANI